MDVTDNVKSRDYDISVDAKYPILFTFTDTHFCQL